MIANGVIDTAMTSRYSATDLAALSIAVSIYVSVFVGAICIAQARHPMGLSYLIEVSPFTFMKLFITRLGETADADHQIRINFVTVLYMLPLSICSAANTLAAVDVAAVATIAVWFGRAFINSRPV